MLDETEIKVSVIIPIYNTEQYVDECLESVVNQSYKNLEIIVINDGSTDGSGDRCKKWLERDSRIRYFEQKNEGPGVARNKGLSFAQGRYISFIDSDDIFNCDFIEYMLQEIEDTAADVAFCDWLYFSNKEISKVMKNFNSEQKIYKKDDACKLTLFSSSFCFRMLRKSFLDEIGFCFPNGFYEDTVVHYAFAYQIRKAVYLPRPLYYYRIGREGSTTSLEITGHSYIELLNRILDNASNKGICGQDIKQIEKRLLQWMKIQLSVYRNKLSSDEFQDIESECNEFWAVRCKNIVQGYIVYGSFNARWIIQKCIKDANYLSEHFVFTGLISQFLSVTIDYPDINLNSIFRKTKLEEDCCKKFKKFCISGNWNDNILVCDFMDECRNVLKLSDGSYITESDIIIESKLNLKSVEIYDYGSDIFWIIWKRACKKFIKCIQKNTPKKIYLLKNRYTTQYKSDGRLIDFDNIESIVRKNKLIEAMENFFLANTTNLCIQVIGIDNEFAYSGDYGDYNKNSKYLNDLYYTLMADYLL